VAEQKILFRNHIEFIQIEVEHENTVLEMMNLRREAVVHHGTFIEAGIHAMSLSPVSTRHRSSADVKASS
jgi:hypothetical protein